MVELKAFWTPEYYLREFREDSQRASFERMAHVNQSYIRSTDDKNGDIPDGNICHLTLEAFPRIDNYQDDNKKKRPSISQLYGDNPYNGVRLCYTFYLFLANIKNAIEKVSIAVFFFLN